jgi:hypothetical protein
MIDVIRHENRTPVRASAKCKEMVKGVRAWLVGFCILNGWLSRAVQGR